MLHILWGPDTFSRDEALKALLGDEGQADAAVLEGAGLTLSQLRLAADAFPFLAPRRVVLVEGLLARFEERRSLREPETRLLRGLRDYLPHLPPTAEVVLRDGEARKTNPCLVQLSPLGEARYFPLLAGSRLQAWIRSRAASLGLEMSPGALQLLTYRVGGNLWGQTQELEKLYLYARGHLIQEADVQLLVADAREANVFALTDAVVQRQGALALRLLGRLAREGAEPAYLLFMITRQFRLNLQARDLLHQGCASAEIGSRLGLTSDFALHKTLDQARRPSLPPIALYRELIQADLDIKRGGGLGSLEMLVARLCQNAT